MSPYKKWPISKPTDVEANNNTFLVITSVGLEYECYYFPKYKSWTTLGFLDITKIVKKWALIQKEKVGK